MLGRWWIVNVKVEKRKWSRVIARLWELSIRGRRLNHQDEGWWVTMGPVVALLWQLLGHCGAEVAEMGFWPEDSGIDVTRGSMILDKHTKYFYHYIASFNHSILLCEMLHILRLLVGFWKKVVLGETCMNSVWCSLPTVACWIPWLLLPWSQVVRIRLLCAMIKFAYEFIKSPNFISQFVNGQDVTGIVHRGKKNTGDFGPGERKSFDWGRSPCNHRGDDNSCGEELACILNLPRQKHLKSTIPT